MRRLIIDIGVTGVVLLLFAPKVFGVGAMMAPTLGGADPTAILLVEQGIQQFGEEKWEAAHASFKLASQIDPTLSAATFNAGVAALQMGRRAEALNDLEAFILRQPGHTEAQRLLSDIQKGSSSYPGRGGGFVEFGVATLLGFLFIFAVAAYDMGVGHPFAEEGADGGEREKEYEEVEWMEGRWRKAA